MKILIRNGKHTKWEPVDVAGYVIEAELQKLLAESPSIITIDEVREGASPLVVAVREFGLPGSGNTDILAFNSQGDIVVVECKLAANQEIKRRVIAQVLEYGAYLWKMSYDELNKRIFSRTQKNLAELVGEAAEDPEWDEEAFRSAVGTNLSRGSFVLVIAVDEMNEELNRTMRYLNTCGNPEFAFTVLEMRRYHRDTTEILVPHLHGAVTQAQIKKDQAKRKRWTEQEFFDKSEAELSPDVNTIIKKLYDWSRLTADRVWFGNGLEKGSFTFHFLLGEKAFSIFTVFTDGTLQLNYGWLIRVLDQNIVNEFHQSILQISSLAQIPGDFNRWPYLKIQDAFIGHSDYFEQFKQSVVEFGKRIKS